MNFRGRHLFTIPYGSSEHGTRTELHGYKVEGYKSNPEENYPGYKSYDDDEDDDDSDDNDNQTWDDPDIDVVV